MIMYFNKIFTYSVLFEHIKVYKTKKFKFFIQILKCIMISGTPCTYGKTSPKPIPREPQQKYRLVTVSGDYWGRGLNQFNGAPTTPSVSEMVQNIWLVVRFA